MLVLLAMSDHGITEWLSGLKRGESTAQHEIWMQVYDRVVSQARQTLKFRGSDRRVRDEEDVALSAIKSLFREVASGRITDLESADSLWKLLTTFTMRKISTKRKYDTTKKRGGSGPDRVQTLDEVAFGTPEEGAGIGQVIGHEPTPDWELTMHEAIAALPVELRFIAVYGLEGKTDKDIAESLGISVKTVKRRKKRLKELWIPNI